MLPSALLPELLAQDGLDRVANSALPGAPVRPVSRVGPRLARRLRIRRTTTA